MTQSIVHPHSPFLAYEIRDIVLFARSLARWNVPLVWENIGDPVAKGECLPDWIKETVARLVMDDSSWAYADSQGDAEARAFLADRANAGDFSGTEAPPIGAEDVVFFNGLGDAIQKILGFVDPKRRVLLPSPIYGAIAVAEAFRTGTQPLFYERDPARGWLPDFERIEAAIDAHPEIAAILLVNPDNPTGAVLKTAELTRFADIARRRRLFLICDETYANVVWSDPPYTRIRQVVGDVPVIALRSISKEYPWPGARCGWIEILNVDANPEFRRYVEALKSSKRIEVCSTNLPQKTLVPVLGDPRYASHLERRATMFRDRAKEARHALSGIDGLCVTKPEGALYLSVVFDESFLRSGNRIEVESSSLREHIDARTAGCAPDKRFAYELLGATGICVVPLSGFHTRLRGFRMTLLETNDGVRRSILENLNRAIGEYLRSGKGREA